jgi:adenylosuccinate synthase
VRILCEQAGIKEDIETYYVSRTYLTRHGAGPLPGEDAKMRFDDDTNLVHPYQGKLRFATLDVDALYGRMAKDGGHGHLVLTHCDQVEPPCKASMYAYGPKRTDVKLNMALAKRA